MLESSSVGHSFAVVRGFRTGDPEKAKVFLDSLPRGELTARNRSDSRLNRKARKRHKMGQRRVRRT